jgi:hypothetical protein
MRIKIFSFVAVFLLLGAGCSSTEPETSVRQEVPENYVSYVDDAGWSIAHPPEWEIEQSVDNDRQVFFYAPKNSSEEFDHNVNVVLSPYGDEFAGPASLMNFAESMLYEDPVTTVEKTELISTPLGQAGMIDYIARPDGKELRAKEITILYGSDVYLLFYTAGAESYEKYLPDFLAMVDSLVPAGLGTQ